MDSNREETNENKKNVCLLSILIRILKNDSQQPLTLLEVLSLNEFSLIKVVPIISFNPRTFIEGMMKIHAECETIILKNSNYLTKFVYKYNSGEKEEEYVFSNNMSFYNDVITICFLHIVQITKCDYSQSVNDLMAIMRKKYRIFHTETFDPLIITENKIVISYPSVTTLLFHNIYETLLLHYNITSPFSKILHKWSLTNIFCSPWLALIIPVIEYEYKTPLALLLAMIVILDNDNKPSYVLYQRILALYTSEVFSRSFKLAVCINWGIVYKEDDRYRFAPYFTRLRKKAIDLILSLKVNDTSVGYTLSQI